MLVKATTIQNEPTGKEKIQVEADAKRLDNEETTELQQSENIVEIVDERDSKPTESSSKGILLTER